MPARAGHEGHEEDEQPQVHLIKTVRARSVGTFDDSRNIPTTRGVGSIRVPRGSALENRLGDSRDAAVANCNCNQSQRTATACGAD